MIVKGRNSKTLGENDECGDNSEERIKVRKRFLGVVEYS